MFFSIGPPPPPPWSPPTMMTLLGCHCSIVPSPQGPTHSSHPAIGAERERCAKLVESMAKRLDDDAMLHRAKIGPRRWFFQSDGGHYRRCAEAMESDARGLRTLAMMIRRGDQP